MTIMPLGNPEFDNELREKREEGYVLLGGAYQDTENEALWERVLFMEDEALAAGLIWEKVSFIVSVREMGLTEKGGRFITKGDYSLGLKPAFYVKPEMLQELIFYLDKTPEAIEVVSAREAQQVRTLEEEQTKTKAEKFKEDSVNLSGQKEKTKVASPVAVIEKHHSEHEPLSKYRVNPHGESGNKEKASPSVIAIFSGIVALIGLGLSKVLVEEKYGHGSADYFFEPIIILIFVSVPVFLALRYIFKEGIDSSTGRLKSLIAGAAIVLVLGWLVSLFDNGGSDCFYIVGCI